MTSCSGEVTRLRNAPRDIISVGSAKQFTLQEYHRRYDRYISIDARFQLAKRGVFSLSLTDLFQLPSALDCMDIPSPSSTKSAGIPSPEHDEKHDGIKPLESLYLKCSSVARLAWQKHIRLDLPKKEYDITKTNITRFCLWKGNFNAGQLDTILLQPDELRVLIEENLVSIGNLFLKIVARWILVREVAAGSSNLVAALTNSLANACLSLSRGDTNKDLRARTARHTSVSSLCKQLNSSFERLMDLTPALEREVQFLEYCGELDIDLHQESQAELLSDTGVSATSSSPQALDCNDSSHEKLPIDTNLLRNPAPESSVNGVLSDGLTDNGSDPNGPGQRTLTKNANQHERGVVGELEELLTYHARTTHGTTTKPGPPWSTLGLDFFNPIPTPSETTQQKLSPAPESNSLSSAVGDFTTNSIPQYDGPFVMDIMGTPPSRLISMHQYSRTTQNIYPITATSTESSNKSPHLFADPSTYYSTPATAQGSSATYREVATSNIDDSACIPPKPVPTKQGIDCSDEARRTLCPGAGRRDERRNKNTPYFCPLCEGRFSRVTSLKRHLETNNPSVLWRCPECSFDRSRKDKIKHHLRVAHGGRLYGSHPIPTARQQICPQSCTICTATQVTWNGWVEHHISEHCKAGESECKEQMEKTIQKPHKTDPLKGIATPELVPVDLNTEKREHKQQKEQKKGD